MSRSKTYQLSKIFHYKTNHIHPRYLFQNSFLQTIPTYPTYTNIPKCYVTTKSTTTQAENIQKAKELHNEVKLLLANQAKRELEHSQKPWSDYFKHLFRTSRAELINIGAAFLCLILALQITGNRRLSKKIIQESQSLEKDVKELEDIVLILRSETFLKELSTLCTNDIMKQNESRSKWIYRSTNTDEKRQFMINTIQTILRREIKKILGYHGMTTNERKERELEIVKDLISEKNTKQDMDLDSFMGELQKASDGDLLGTTNMQDESSDAKVKKTKFIM